MTNPFETSAPQGTKNFTLEYHHDSIKVATGDNYQLTWPDGRWLKIHCQEDYSKTEASSDAGTRQMVSSQWVIDATSGGPDWVNREQLQVIGELINRKEQEFDRSKE
jgi:hypothetical protein